MHGWPPSFQQDLLHFIFIMEDNDDDDDGATAEDDVPFLLLAHIWGELPNYYS